MSLRRKWDQNPGVATHPDGLSGTMEVGWSAMSYVFRTIKKLFFWGYARNTWQYDVLCALILAFIFLTPQGWFDTGSPPKGRILSEPAHTVEHQKPVASKFILAVADNLPAQMTPNQIESHLRSITGRVDTQVLNVEPKRDASGKIVAYEVDIK